MGHWRRLLDDTKLYYRPTAKFIWRYLLNNRLSICHNPSNVTFLFFFIVLTYKLKICLVTYLLNCYCALFYQSVTCNSPALLILWFSFLSCFCSENLELLNSSNLSMSNLGYIQMSLKDPLLSVSLFCHLASIILCTLILSETLALYKSFTYLLINL